MKFYYISVFLALFTLASPNSAKAQFWKKIKNNVEKKINKEAEKRVNKRTNKGIDNAFDAVEDGIDGKESDKNNSTQTSQQNNQTNTNNEVNNASGSYSSSSSLFQGLDGNNIATTKTYLSKTEGRNRVDISNKSGIIAKKGSVFVYKTSEGNHGKLEIIDVDKSDNYKITFRYVTYDNSGNTVSQSNNFSVRGTYTFDLDIGIEEGVERNDRDFFLNREDNTSTNISSYNNSSIKIYNTSLAKSNAKSVDPTVSAPVIKWNKFDFVPGDIVLFEDAPSPDEENGEFPSRWDMIAGVTEIVEVDGENVIMFLEGNYRGGIVPYLKNSEKDYLPDTFTIEFDAYFPPNESNFRYYLSFYDRKNQRYGNNDQVTLQINQIEIGNTTKKYPGVERGNRDKIGKIRHFSVAFTKGKLKIYMDDTRLINIPHYEANPSGISIIGAFENAYIKNFRLAKGGVKYYDRVLSEGKIIVNGIRFDIDRATIKPESNGAINKIYKLMVKKPDLNFSVEGHTDSDGNDTNNMKLSKERGEAVMNRLISMGISADRLKYNGFGESKPLDTNATVEGKANNRRVEFVKF